MSIVEKIKSSKKKTEKKVNLAGSRATVMFRDKLAELTSSGEITQSDVAKHLGLVQHYVSMMKSGKTKISLPKAIDIADRLDIPRNEFMLAVIEQHFPELTCLGEVLEDAETASRIRKRGVSIASLTLATEEQVEAINKILSN